jgi:hypothetical protein
MKSNFFKIVPFISMVTSVAAHANYSLASKKGSVFCEGRTSATVYAISANRKVIAIAGEGDDQVTNYRILKTDSNGETSITYFTKGFSLTLNDQGDSISGYFSEDLSCE